jgi:S-(hydroxymethyl)glutathione dehydrogenase/alcohol dehydrogenase
MQGWGKTIILGVEMHGAPLSLPARQILNGKTFTGSLFGGVKPKQDIPILADKYLNKVRFRHTDQSVSLLVPIKFKPW